jgi:uncharacterized protein (TIGR03083 family)
VNKAGIDGRVAATASDLVRQAADECTAFLDGVVEEDWTRPIPGSDWTVAKAVAHQAGVLLWYATDLAAGPGELSTAEISVDVDSPPSELVATIRAFSRVLSAVIDCSEPLARGWHPFGVSDATGFAAMACDEMLVHTYDAALGLGLDFTPSASLARSTVRRLFPWAPSDDDPWKALRWANGRIAISGLRMQVKWVWHCAPLSEWDGKNPNDAVAVKP